MTSAQLFSSPLLAACQAGSPRTSAASVSVSAFSEERLSHSNDTSRRALCIVQGSDDNSRIVMLLLLDRK